MTQHAKKSLLAAIAAMSISAPALADDGSAAIDTARKAIAIGYGADCSLDMKPVERGGYYPCIDISPYRIVFAYGTVKAFVIQTDRAPYPIMDAPAESPDFLSDGPWRSDMSARVALWWSDTVEGGARRLKDAQDRSENQKAAEAYVSKLMGKDENPPAGPAPQVPAKEPDALEVGDDIRDILAH